MAAALQDSLTAIAGLSLIGWVLSDVFQAIIVPHYRPNRFRLSYLLPSRILWRPLRQLVIKMPSNDFVRSMLPMFAPAAMMTLLFSWLTVMVTGYALILWAERAHISPHLRSFEDAIYFAASSVLTVGFGDVVACTFLSRSTVVCSAFSGIVLLALTVSFLFATQSHFHGREVVSQIIAARSQHSCDGLLLYHNICSKSDASSILELCERWIIDIYQSHAAYPLLMYFHSRSSRISWLSQVGAVLDTASLVLAVGPSRYTDVAHSIFDAGSRALAVFSSRLTLHKELDRKEDHLNKYVDIFRTLKVDDPVSAATRLSAYRHVYLSDLEALCQYFLIAPPVFSADSLRVYEQSHSDESLAMTVQTKRVFAPGRTQEFEKKPQGVSRK